MVETGGLRDAVENDGLGATLLWVVNVFKYFSVDAERELSGVAPDMSGRDAPDIPDSGLSGEMQERPL